MTHTKAFIFVSIDGMTDPLGQSQVLPYLRELASFGNEITIVSCEKRENWILNHQTIQKLVSESNITWNYCFYQTGIPFLSQVKNYKSLKKKVISVIETNSKKYVLHCRSYLPGLIGLYSKQKYNTGFIFDMRGFWADERIEGGIWSKKNPLTSYMYSFFKRKEKQMLVNSDAIVTLTHKAKNVILNWNLNIDEQKITVIPCCADLNHFSRVNLNDKRTNEFIEQFPMLKNKFVLTYVGSLGTWYMADEMFGFFKCLSQNTDSHFLVITKDDEEIASKAAELHNVSKENYTIKSSSRVDMPYYISLSDASLFFIRPSFSKTASSPTKMGELLSMEIPVITNSGVGDVDEIISETNCGVVITDFNQKEYQIAIKNILEKRNLYQANTIKAANTFFSLKDGVDKYKKIYNTFK